MSDRFGDDWEFPTVVEGVPTKYTWLVQHKDNLSLGYKTDVGAFTYINALHGVVIEDLVQIGSHCSIYTVSTIDGTHGPIRLEKNCRIGSHAVIMPGVTVGRNAIVGAMSLVTEDVPPNTMAMGAPARVVRELSEDETDG